MADLDSWWRLNSDADTVSRFHSDEKLVPFEMLAGGSRPPSRKGLIHENDAIFEVIDQPNQALVLDGRAEQRIRLQQ